MNTSNAINLAGSAKALADLLEITPSAVSQWGDVVPDSRIWQLRVLRPMWFDEKAGKPNANTAQPAIKTVANQGA